MSRAWTAADDPAFITIVAVRKTAEIVAVNTRKSRVAELNGPGRFLFEGKPPLTLQLRFGRARMLRPCMLPAGLVACIAGEGERKRKEDGQRRTIVCMQWSLPLGPSNDVKIFLKYRERRAEPKFTDAMYTMAMNRRVSRAAALRSGGSPSHSSGKI